jgi:hypothetical protein
VGLVVVQDALELFPAGLFEQLLDIVDPARLPARRARVFVGSELGEEQALVWMRRAEVPHPCIATTTAIGC